MDEQHRYRYEVNGSYILWIFFCVILLKFGLILHITWSQVNPNIVNRLEEHELKSVGKDESGNWMEVYSLAFMFCLGNTSGRLSGKKGGKKGKEIVMMGNQLFLYLFLFILILGNCWVSLIVFIDLCGF